MCYVSLVLLILRKKRELNGPFCLSIMGVLVLCDHVNGLPRNIVLNVICFGIKWKKIIFTAKRRVPIRPSVHLLEKSVDDGDSQCHQKPFFFLGFRIDRGSLSDDDNQDTNKHKQPQTHKMDWIYGRRRLNCWDAYTKSQNQPATHRRTDKQ